MNEDAVSYLEGALSKLAYEWRGEEPKSRRRQEIQKEYEEVANVLLSWGWKMGMEPDSELPRGFMPKEYMKIVYQE